MKEENKEINKKDEIPQEEVEEITEKVSITDVGKEFLSPELPELDVKEEISQYPDEVVSPEVKKELQTALDKVEKGIMKPTDGGQAKNNKNLKVSKEQSIDYLKKNPVQVNTKFKLDKETGKVIKNKDYTNNEEDKIR